MKLTICTIYYVAQACVTEIKTRGTSWEFYMGESSPRCSLSGFGEIVTLQNVWLASCFLKDFMKFLLKNSPCTFSLNFCTLGGFIYGKDLGWVLVQVSAPSFPDHMTGNNALGFSPVKWVNNICLKLYVKWLCQCSASSRCSLNLSLLPLPLLLSAVMPYGIFVTSISISLSRLQAGCPAFTFWAALCTLIIENILWFYRLMI